MAIYNTKFENYINYFIENPFKSWWKARKYFKFPRVSINFFTHPRYNCPYASYRWIGKILDIRICDVYWKTKYDDIRFERPPYIWVCFFKRFGFSVNFNVFYKDEFGEKNSANDFYWEYLLNYTFKQFPLSKAYSTCYSSSKLYSVYNYTDNKSKALEIPIPIVSLSLNKEGIKHLKNELNEGMRDK